MLFSRDDVAAFIHQNFEAAWESVRPVPIVRIDFGGGTVLTRTLNGNIATYVCAADGQALDVAAGAYNPETYLARLAQFRLLANYVDQQGKGQRDARLREYHRGQAEALAKDETPQAFINTAGLSKGKIEGGVLATLVPGEMAAAVSAAGGPAARGGKRAGDGEDVAAWKSLAEDSRLNETVRRRQVSGRLAAAAPVRPEGLKKWLYKEVLHADLDDPYLGLGQTLFANYPFRDEDGR